MPKTAKIPTWSSQSKNNRSDFIRDLSSVASPQPLKEILLPRSLDLNFTFEIKYRR